MRRTEGDLPSTQWPTDRGLGFLTVRRSMAAWRRALCLIGASLIGPVAATAADTDLSISINHSPNPGVGLQQVIFTVHVSNLGPAAATSIKVVNTLPPGMVMDTRAAVRAGTVATRGTHRDLHVAEPGRGREHLLLGDFVRGAGRGRNVQRHGHRQCDSKPIRSPATIRRAIRSWSIERPRSRSTRSIPAASSILGVPCRTREGRPWPPTPSATST